jgi:hypothetical protein
VRTHRAVYASPMFAGLEFVGQLIESFFLRLNRYYFTVEARLFDEFCELSDVSADINYGVDAAAIDPKGTMISS